MKNFLKKIGLVDYLSTELAVDQTTFVNRLKENVDHHSNGLFEIFNSSKKEYRGTVGYNNFEIQRREFYSYQNQLQAKVKGNLYQNGEKLVIESEISGYSPWLLLIFIFLLFVYASFLGAFLFTGADFGAESFFILPFLAIHAALMFYVPYRMLKRAVEKSKYDLEREFFYLAR